MLLEELELELELEELDEEGREELDELDGREDDGAGALLRETAAGRDGGGDGRLTVGGDDAGREGAGVAGLTVAAGRAGVDWGARYVEVDGVTVDLGGVAACGGLLLIPGGGGGAVVFKPLGFDSGVCTLGSRCLISLMRSCCRFKDSSRICRSLFCQSENCWAWGWGWVLAG